MANHESKLIHDENHTARPLISASLQTMKTKLFIVLFSFASGLFAKSKSEVIADTTKSVEHSSKHELCLSYSNPFNNLFSSMYWNDYYSIYLNSNNYPYFPVNNFSAPSYGLSYKYHSSDRMAFRLGLDFNNSNNHFRQTSSSSNPIPNATESYGLTQLGASIGMEVSKGDGKTQWFAGGDLFYEHFNINYRYTDIGVLNTYTQGSNAFGISPLIGVRYYISKMVSVSVDSKLNIFYNHYTIDEINTSSSNNVSFNNYAGGGCNVKISPIAQLGVNIHF